MIAVQISIICLISVLSSKNGTQILLMKLILKPPTFFPDINAQSFLSRKKILRRVGRWAGRFSSS